MAQPVWLTRAALAALFVAAAGLAWLAGRSSSAPQPGSEPEAAGRQVVQQFVRDGATLNYLIFLPADYDKDARRWPLLLFLHGAAGAGNDFGRVKHYVLPQLVETQTDFPFILVSPQSPQQSWDLGLLNSLIDEVAARHRVDLRRISVTGASMGARATWALAAAHPQKFAAIMPLSGSGNPADAAKLRDLPIWVFHGARDEIIAPRASEQMVEALRAAGATKVTYTLYPDAGHDTFPLAYRDPQVWAWLVQQRR